MKFARDGDNDNIKLYGYPDFEKRLRDVVVNLVDMAFPEKEERR